MQELSNAEIQLTQGQQQASDGKEQILAQVSQIQTQMGDAWPQDSWKSYETAVENGSTYNSEKTTFQTDLKTRIESSECCTGYTDSSAGSECRRL